MDEPTHIVSVKLMKTPPADGLSGRAGTMHAHHQEPGIGPHIIDIMSNIGLGGMQMWFVVDGQTELVVDLLPAIEELGYAAIVKHDTGTTYLRPDEQDWSTVTLPLGMDPLDFLFEPKE
jgi:hypothetical protein